MSRRVNQVENVFLPVLCLVDCADCLCLDCDSSFPFQIHIIQYLGLHLPACQKSGIFNDPVRKRRLPMVDMGNDAEIPYMFLINY